jgi:hypothetical protein
MGLSPHKDKLCAALNNPKCPHKDRDLIRQTIDVYNDWTEKLSEISSKGKKSVEKMTELLNWYKNQFEVELIMKRGSNFIKRQKGQLKLDNTILEEFLISLIHPDILSGLDNIDMLKIGPYKSFMSLAFLPKSLKGLTQKPYVFIKNKDQDFVLGTEIHYRFSTDKEFHSGKTIDGSLILAVLAAECKVNLDKTMFQEAAGTAARLKQGCPVAKYFLLVEYLDMIPEDCRLTAIDNVFLLRHAKRLPFGKRNVSDEVERLHKAHPIDPEIVWLFVQEIQRFVDAIWYNPDQVLERGTFV